MSKTLGKYGMQKIHNEGIARKMSKCLDPSPQQQ